MLFLSFNMGQALPNPPPFFFFGLVFHGLSLVFKGAQAQWFVAYPSVWVFLIVFPLFNSAYVFLSEIVRM